MKTRLKPIFAFLGLILLVLVVSLSPELVGGDLADFLKKKLGDKYFYVIGGLGLLAVFLYTYYSDGERVFSRKARSTSVGGVSEDNLQEIRSSLLESYQKRIDSKLASRFPINIEVAYTREGSPTKGHLYNKSLRISDLKKELIEIFDKQQGRLLIIGAPGAGKTTLLLQLAIKLLERGEEQIPLIINIATWRPRFTVIEEWLEELLPQMGFSKALALQMIKERRLLLLFDGLDELAEEERPGFLDAVAGYGKDNTAKYAICSRVIEYAATKDAAVEGQVMVKPLSLTQIIQGLKETKSPETHGLLDAIDKDPLLAEALRTPFYLNTAQLIFSSKAVWEEFEFAGNNLELREQEIVKAFVINSADSIALISEEKIKRWLSFLAHNLNQHNQVVLELASLQYDWHQLNGYQNAVRYLVYSIILGFISGVIYGLAGGMIYGIFVDLGDGLYYGPRIGIIYGTIVTLILGFALALSKKRSSIAGIVTQDKINWSWSAIINRLFDKFELVNGLIGALLYGLISSLIFNRGIGIAFGVAYLLLYCLFAILKNSQSYLKITHPYQRFYASMWSLHFSIIQHFHLRWILYRKGLLPWRLVDFLNEATKNHILESDGGTWRFRHRILQDYFADYWEEHYAATEDGMIETNQEEKNNPYSPI